jgi:hypothetical protein
MALSRVNYVLFDVSRRNRAVNLACSTDSDRTGNAVSGAP